MAHLRHDQPQVLLFLDGGELAGGGLSDEDLSELWGGDRVARFLCRNNVCFKKVVKKAILILTGLSGRGLIVGQGRRA